jgi:hypothetical protein
MQKSDSQQQDLSERAITKNNSIQYQPMYFNEKQSDNS